MRQPGIVTCFGLRLPCGRHLTRRHTSSPMLHWFPGFPGVLRLFPDKVVDPLPGISPYPRGFSLRRTFRLIVDFDRSGGCTISVWLRSPLPGCVNNRMHFSRASGTQVAIYRVHHVRRSGTFLMSSQVRLFLYCQFDPALDHVESAFLSEPVQGMGVQWYAPDR